MATNYLRRNKRANGKRSGNAHAQTQGQKHPKHTTKEQKRRDDHRPMRTEQKRKHTTSKLILEMREATESSDWEYIAAEIDAHHLYLEPGIILPLLYHCEDDHVRRLVILKALKEAESQLLASQSDSEKHMLSAYLIDLTGDHRGIDHRFEEIVLLVQSIWDNRPPNEVRGKIEHYQRKQRQLAQSNGKSVRVRHKKKPHSHPIAHMTPEEKRARNDRARERKHKKHLEKNK